RCRRGWIIRSEAARGEGSGAVLWRWLLGLEKIALNPAFEVVILGFDLAPGARGDGLVVACQQHLCPFAQDTRARRCWSGLLADGHPKPIGVDDQRFLELGSGRWRRRGWLGWGWHRGWLTEERHRCRS